jgi:hypothetical protein
MKTRFSSLLLILGFVTASGAIAATANPSVALQPPVSADSLSTSATELRQQTDRLFLGNDRLGDQSMTMASSTNPPVSDKDPMTAKNAASTENILALDPYDVTAGKPIVLPPTFHVTPQNFVRTGVIAMHQSKKVTTYLWAKGDDGLMFTLSF